MNITAHKHDCTIPRPEGELALTVETGRSIIIVGANGSGKTRLGVHLENSIAGQPVHRIAAHKSLVMQEDVNLISLERAEKLLRLGATDAVESHKLVYRWGQKPEVHLLNDFEGLLQSLFAEQNRVATQHLHARAVTPCIPVPDTKLGKLKNIWDALLPHRELVLMDTGVRVRSPGGGDASYSGSEMSDGERCIFYFLGQCLMAPANCVLIIDEPETYVHKAIVGPLWDAIEKARPDCAFLYITHDLDFAVGRPSATRYFIKSYRQNPEAWDIQELPKETGLPEEVVAEVVGSRKPVLFVEGERGSLDMTIYRHRYSGFTIMPVGGCGDVIHCVASHSASDALHWLKARGLVDADDRSEGDAESLAAHGVEMLPVAEVENLLVLPDVFLALAEALQCSDPAGRLEKLRERVMGLAREHLDLVSARYATRQLDRRLKKVTVKAKDKDSLKAEYEAEIRTIDPAALFTEFREKLEAGIAKDDLEAVLKLYDNKGMVAEAAKALGVAGAKELMEKLGRLLGNKEGEKVSAALRAALPEITA